MRNGLTRFLSAFVLYWLLVLPPAALVARWRIEGLPERPDLWDYLGVALWCYIAVTLLHYLATVVVVNPLHRWLGVLPATDEPEPPAEDEDREDPPSTFRARPV